MLKMEPLSKSYLVLFYFIFLIHSFGSYIFYKGFLPNSSKTGTAAFHHHESYSIHTLRENIEWSKKYDRLIFVLIDALRADFVFTEKSQLKFMPFLQNKVKDNKTFSYISVGNSPTVTMPRIKGLTSGAIPNFHDVLMNAASTEFLEDNIINSFVKSGRNITFFGDDTWVKLFPKHFLRSDGTQSFYVNDYTEVDNNVTRHLSQELEKTDWDAMILHYLGLDHIGHTVGPFNPLINHKLLEMDSVIKRIFQSIETFDSTHGTKSLLLITGDHGMSNAGSHGGASKEELNTPCIFLSPYDNGEVFKGITVKQVDLAVTLAILFGVQIPRNSIGKPIQLINKLYDLGDTIKIEKQLACHFHTIISQNHDTSSDILKHLERICYNAAKDDGVIEQVIEMLGSLSSEYNEIFMIVSLIFMLLVCIITIGLLFCFSQCQCDLTFSNFTAIYPILSMVITVISLSSSSLVEEEQYLYYYFVVTFFIGLYFKLISKDQKNSQAIATVLILMRVIYRWNRTGIKWSGLKDIEDYLNQNAILLVILIFVGILFVLVLFAMQQRQCYFANLCALLVLSLSLLCFKICSTGYFSSDEGICSKKLLLFTARLVYIFLVILLILSRLGNTSFSKICWIFLSLLLLKPTNFPWLCLVVALEYILSSRIIPILLKNKDTNNIITYFYIYYGLGKLSFYAQGNSNNLATVDISSGIIGLTEYDPVVSVIISYIGTYCSNFLWYFSLKDSLPECYVRSIGLCICIFQMFQSTFFYFIVYVMRYHLFIWSVFAPKFLYMFIESLVNVFVVFPLLYISST